MKKILSLILALALVMALSVTAFAAEPPVTTLPGSGNASIEATFSQPDDQVVHNYSVTIAWAQTGTLKYTTDQAIYTWNTTDLKYDNTTSGDADWTIENAQVTITVTNRSDVAITATCGDPDPVTTTGVTVITGSYDSTSNGTLSLDSAAPAELTGVGSETTASAVYTITGVDGAITAPGSIGTITVSLAAA